MSDRIDELVAAIDANTLLQWDGKDVALVAARELAAIAREAEARAAEWIDRCYQSEERALKAEVERDALLATIEGMESDDEYAHILNAERVIHGE